MLHQVDPFVRGDLCLGLFSAEESKVFQIRILSRMIKNAFRSHWMLHKSDSPSLAFGVIGSRK